MRNPQSGFVIPLLLVLIVLVVFGGGAYFYVEKPKTLQLQTPSTTTTSATATPTVAQNETANWKTYTNIQHGYSIQYSASANVILNGSGWGANNKWVTYTLEDSISSTTDWYASTCVEIVDANHKWSVSILAETNFSGSSCSARTGTSVTNIRIEDTFTVDGKQFKAAGLGEPDWSNGDYNSSLNNRVGVTYVIFGNNNADYQSALNVVHQILSTLKLVPNFVPSNPPPKGRG